MFLCCKFTEFISYNGKIYKIIRFLKLFFSKMLVNPNSFSNFGEKSKSKNYE